MVARPFIKSAGGKTKLLPELFKRVPKKFGNYHEPFVGGGAFYFALKGADRLKEWSYISDYNARLVCAYQAVKEVHTSLVRQLKGMKNTLEFFLKTRSREIDFCSDLEKAAWFIYLNKTAFNGLWRVNKSGQFNVPFAYYKNPLICDVDNLLACEQVLNVRTIIRHSSFERVLSTVKPHDFVYLDPPYMPLSTTSNFASYTSAGFGLQEHIKLRDVALELKRRKVKILLSNSNCTAVRELYAKGFKIEEVYAARSINADGNNRGKIVELLIT